MWINWALSAVFWQAYWSGLNDRSTEGSWLWADGSAPKTDIVQWNQEPNDLAGREDCAMIMPDGVFNDGSCNFKTGYICESFSEDSPCPTGWISYYIACFLFQPGNDDDVTLTWYEARDRCRDLAVPAIGFMLAISSETELEFVTKNIKALGPNATSFWTGLNDRFDEGLWTYEYWYNNPPNMSLIQWNSEPNGGPDANCGVIMSGGRYDDQDCNIKHKFICEKPVKASSYLRYHGTSASRQTVSQISVMMSALFLLLARNAEI